MRNPPLFPVYPIETLRDLLSEAVRRYDKRQALVSKKHGKYEPTSYRQLGERVRELAAAFSLCGLGKSDRVALLGPNRTEWAMAYLAIVRSGLVAVPIDKDLKPREIRHILAYSGSRLLVGSGEYISEFRRTAPERPACLETMVSMEDSPEEADYSLPEFLQKGYELLERGSWDEPELAANDLAAIIFTSGTTGGSKAVMLTHGNLSSNILSTSQFVSISQDDRVLSVLPLHHTYECTCGFLTALYQGATIFYAENLRRIPENLQESKATVMLGVPVLFESFYSKIQKAVGEKGPRKFAVARTAAGWAHRLLRLDLRKLLFRQIHARMGGHMRLLISGGAAMKPEVSRGFRDIGINFIQGYGMTEASPLIAVNREDAFKDASVGRPIPGVEVKIENSEICVRGPNVMPGYYLNETATAQALRDGWLHTGDLGYLDEDGFLFINGRSKSLIVTPNGKNVYPEEIESLLNESPYILESLVWGGPETDPGLVEVQAIIVPDSELFDRHFGASQWDEGTVQKVIAQEVKSCNQNLAGFKRVKKFVVREAEFEKTTTRKIKRYLYTGKSEPLAGDGGNTGSEPVGPPESEPLGKWSGDTAERVRGSSPHE